MPPTHKEPHQAQVTSSCLPALLLCFVAEAWIIHIPLGFFLLPPPPPMIWLVQSIVGFIFTATRAGEQQAPSYRVGSFIFFLSGSGYLLFVVHCSSCGRSRQPGGVLLALEPFTPKARLRARASGMQVVCLMYHRGCRLVLFVFVSSEICSAEGASIAVCCFCCCDSVCGFYICVGWRSRFRLLAFRISSGHRMFVLFPGAGSFGRPRLARLGGGYRSLCLGEGFL